VSGQFTTSTVLVNTTPLGLKTDDAGTVESTLAMGKKNFPNLSMNDKTY